MNLRAQRQNPHFQRLRQDFANLALDQAKRTTGEGPARDEREEPFPKYQKDFDPAEAKVNFPPRIQFLIQYANELRENQKNKILKMAYSERSLPETQKTVVTYSVEDFDTTVEEIPNTVYADFMGDVADPVEPITDEELLQLIIGPGEYDPDFDEGAGEEGIDDIDYREVFD